MKLDNMHYLNVLLQVCVFRADRKSQEGVTPDLWLPESFSILLCKSTTEFNETWQDHESSTQRPLPSVLF